MIPALAVTAGAWRDPAHSWPGAQGDNYEFMTFLTWVPHSLASLNNPLWMGLLDYPNGVNLAWNTPVPLGGLVLWPVTAAWGPVIAYNVFVTVALFLDVACVYLWLRRHVGSAWAALLPSLLLGLGPWVGVHLIHLQLLSFWPIPLLLIIVEDVLVGRGSPVRQGLLAGALVSVEFYLSEELVVLTAVALVAGLAAALIFGPRVRPRPRHVVVTASIAAAISIVVGGPMLLYQLFGPRAVHGVIQSLNYYVTDPENLIVPTPRTWLWPAAWPRATNLSGLGEASAYVGVPLLLVALGAAVWRWKDPVVRTIAVTTLLVAVLSLGPHLHWAGADTGLRLPGVVFSHLPLLANILPVRFSLLTDLGLAFLMSTALDAGFGGRRFGARTLSGIAIGIVVLVSLVPVLPVAASSAAIPAYFQRGGAASKLPPGTVALVGPYIDDGEASAVPMLWQSESDFRFALIDGLAITLNGDGRVTWLPDNAVHAAFHQIQADGVTPAETPSLRAALLAELRARGVNLVVLGPMPHRPLALAFVTWLVGRPAQEVGGVSLWRL